ncbi:hypothetical protein BYT27DRAFT_7182819 [Phlegmacium glaucopus]|nr:hypothetical protein BYT27DRAFT_7182819 [Phlegmacium glaucopus]
MGTPLALAVSHASYLRFFPVLLNHLPLKVLCQQSTSSTSAIPSNPSAACPRIPRLPDAFMLLRSDFLKGGIIPSNVGRRQQDLSRIVGEVWNMLGPAEGAKWHERAAIALSEHQQKNPGFKLRQRLKGRVATRAEVEEIPLPTNSTIFAISEKHGTVASPCAEAKTTKNRSLDTEKHISIPPLFTAF